MLRRKLVLGSVLVCALLASGLLPGQQQPSPKGKGKLPLYWNKLGLSEEQRKKVSAIMASYKVKIDALKAEISKLEEEEKKELNKVLTEQQRDELRKIIANRALSETPAAEKKSKDDDKSKAEKKPSDK